MAALWHCVQDPFISQGLILLFVLGRKQRKAAFYMIIVSWFNGSGWHVYLWCNLCFYIQYSELCSRGSPAWTRRTQFIMMGSGTGLTPDPSVFDWNEGRAADSSTLLRGAPVRPGSAPADKSIHYIFPPDLCSDPDCRSPVRAQLVWTAGPANKTSLHWRGKGALALTLSELFTLALVIIMHYMKGRIPFIIDHCVSSALELLPL